MKAENTTKIQFDSLSVNESYARGRSGGLSCPVRPHRAAAGRYQNGSV